MSPIGQVYKGGTQTPRVSAIMGGTDQPEMGQGGEGAGRVAKAIASVTQTAKVAINAAVGNPRTAVCSGGDPRAQGMAYPLPPQTQPSPGDEHKMDPAPDYGYKSYKGHNRLAGKVALITGGDSGIGRAVALAFAREGADVSIIYYNEHKDAEVAKQAVEEAGRSAMTLAVDLATEAGCKAAVEATVKKFGRIDCLVNNAAFQGKVIKDLPDISRERLERTFNTNIIAMFTLTQEAIPHMGPGSSVINTSSVLGYSPMPEILDYSVTKAAIVGYTKGAAMLLMKNHGIRVNGVAPGPIWTPIMPNSMTGSMVTTIGADLSPTGRAGQPRECSPAFVFLASDEASYVNGETLAVSGGIPTM